MGKTKKLSIEEKEKPKKKKLKSMVRKIFGLNKKEKPGKEAVSFEDTNRKVHSGVNKWISSDFQDTNEVVEDVEDEVIPDTPNPPPRPPLPKKQRSFDGEKKSVLSSRLLAQNDDKKKKANRSLTFSKKLTDVRVFERENSLSDTSEVGDDQRGKKVVLMRKKKNKTPTENEDDTEGCTSQEGEEDETKSLSEYSYKELQKRAKELQLPANTKKTTMISAIQEKEAELLRKEQENDIKAKLDCCNSQDDEDEEVDDDNNDIFVDSEPDVSMTWHVAGGTSEDTDEDNEEILSQGEIEPITVSVADSRDENEVKSTDEKEESFNINEDTVNNSGSSKNETSEGSHAVDNSANSESSDSDQDSIVTDESIVNDEVMNVDDQDLLALSSESDSEVSEVDPLSDNFAQNRNIDAVKKDSETVTVYNADTSNGESMVVSTEPIAHKDNETLSISMESINQKGSAVNITVSSKSISGDDQSSLSESLAASHTNDIEIQKMGELDIRSNKHGIADHSSDDSNVIVEPMGDKKTVSPEEDRYGIGEQQHVADTQKATYQPFHRNNAENHSTAVNVSSNVEEVDEKDNSLISSLVANFDMEKDDGGMEDSLINALVDEFNKNVTKDGVHIVDDQKGVMNSARENTRQESTKIEKPAAIPLPDSSEICATTLNDSSKDSIDLKKDTASSLSSSQVSVMLKTNDAPSDKEESALRVKPLDRGKTSHASDVSLSGGSDKKTDDHCGNNVNDKEDDHDKTSKADSTSETSAWHTRSSGSDVGSTTDLDELVDMDAVMSNDEDDDLTTAIEVFFTEHHPDKVGIEVTKESNGVNREALSEADEDEDLDKFEDIPIEDLSTTGISLSGNSIAGNSYVHINPFQSDSYDDESSQGTSPYILRMGACDEVSLGTNPHISRVSSRSSRIGNDSVTGDLVMEYNNIDDDSDIVPHSHRKRRSKMGRWADDESSQGTSPIIRMNSRSSRFTNDSVMGDIILDENNIEEDSDIVPQSRRKSRVRKGRWVDDESSQGTSPILRMNSRSSRFTNDSVMGDIILDENNIEEDSDIVPQSRRKRRARLGRWVDDESSQGTPHLIRMSRSSKFTNDSVMGDIILEENIIEEDSDIVPQTRRSLRRGRDDESTVLLQDDSTAPLPEEDILAALENQYSANPSDLLVKRERTKMSEESHQHSLIQKENADVNRFGEGAPQSKNAASYGKVNTSNPFQFVDLGTSLSVNAMRGSLLSLQARLLKVCPAGLHDELMMPEAVDRGLERNGVPPSSPAEERIEAEDMESPTKRNRPQLKKVDSAKTFDTISSLGDSDVVDQKRQQILKKHADEKRRQKKQQDKLLREQQRAKEEQRQARQAARARLKAASSDVIGQALADQVVAGRMGYGHVTTSSDVSNTLNYDEVVRHTESANLADNFIYSATSTPQSKPSHDRGHSRSRRDEFQRSSSYHPSTNTIPERPTLPTNYSTSSLAKHEPSRRSLETEELQSATSDTIIDTFKSRTQKQTAALTAKNLRLNTKQLNVVPSHPKSVNSSTEQRPKTTHPPEQVQKTSHRDSLTSRASSGTASTQAAMIDIYKPLPPEPTISPKYRPSPSRISSKNKGISSNSSFNSDNDTNSLYQPSVNTEDDVQSKASSKGSHHSAPPTKHQSHHSHHNPTPTPRTTAAGRMRAAAIKDRIAATNASAESKQVTGSPISQRRARHSGTSIGSKSSNCSSISSSGNQRRRKSADSQPSSEDVTQVEEEQVPLTVVSRSDETLPTISETSKVKDARQPVGLQENTRDKALPEVNETVADNNATVDSISHTTVEINDSRDPVATVTMVEDSQESVTEVQQITQPELRTKEYPNSSSKCDTDNPHSLPHDEIESNGDESVPINVVVVAASDSAGNLNSMGVDNESSSVIIEKSLNNTSSGDTSGGTDPRQSDTSKTKSKLPIASKAIAVKSSTSSAPSSLVMRARALVASRHERNTAIKKSTATKIPAKEKEDEVTSEIIVDEGEKASISPIREAQNPFLAII